MKLPFRNKIFYKHLQLQKDHFNVAIFSFRTHCVKSIRIQGYFFIILMSYGKIDNLNACNYCSFLIIGQKHFKSQRHRASLKRIRSGLDLLYIFRNILIFTLMSYGIDKNCTFDILKELLRYYRKTLLFFKRLVINKDLLSIRILCKILENWCKSQF